MLLSNSVGCTVKSATKTVTIPCREGKINSEEIQIINQQNSDEIKVILPSDDGVITVYDITGRMIRTNDSNEGEYILVRSQLTPGIYVLNVTSGTHAKTMKLVIE